jgi:hypothetical protein
MFALVCLHRMGHLRLMAADTHVGITASSMCKPSSIPICFVMCRIFSSFAQRYHFTKNLFTVDMGYYQVTMNTASSGKNAITTPFRMFEYWFMLFGLCTAT